MCSSPSFFLLAGCSLSVFQQGTYIQFWRTFHPSICTSYWPICLPSFNSQQVTFTLIFSSFLVFNLITQFSTFSAENAFSEASFSLSRLSPGFISLSSSAHFLPLAFAAWWACDSPASLIFVSSLNAPFVLALQEFYMAVSLDALICLIPAPYHVLWLFILAVKDPCQFTPSFFCCPLLSTSSQYRERSYAAFA